MGGWLCILLILITEGSSCVYCQQQVRRDEKYLKFFPYSCCTRLYLTIALNMYFKCNLGYFKYFFLNSFDNFSFIFFFLFLLLRFFFSSFHFPFSLNAFHKARKLCLFTLMYNFGVNLTTDFYEISYWRFC